MNIHKWRKSTKGFIVAEVSCFAVAVGLNNYPVVAIPIMGAIMLGFGIWLVKCNPDKIGVKKE
jgi:hypothetical protein